MTLSASQGVDVLRAAGEPSRLRILALLAREELAVLEICRVLDQSQPRVSRHLKLLAEAGLVERFPDGAWVFYRLTGEGLVVTTTATNAGDRACPYGCGQHPYLSPGSGLLDDCDLELAAGTRIATDEDRQLPVGTESVAGTAFDFRTRRRIGSLHVDFAFTDLARDREGRAWVRLWGADGRCAELWVDEGYPFVEIYTGDTLAPDRRRRGLGTEPMSCPPNALQSGEGVIRLEPGASVAAQWGARLGA